MQFEILSITEGNDGTPAAEIQFNRQRVCLIRFSSSGAPQIEFLQDLYVGRSTEMIFPLSSFQEAVQQAVDDLAAWLQNLAERESET